MIDKTDWDCLAILDACRYDYFEEVYGDYLNGHLRKAISEASRTHEWRERTFKNGDYSDVVYVTAVPRVETKGMEIVGGFRGVDYFYKVIDAWNKQGEITLPSQIARATRWYRAKYPSKRLISHFSQPHFPYLSLSDENELIKKVRGFIGRTAEKVLGISRIRQIRDSMNLRQADQMESIARERGKKALRNAYKEDLRIVLEEVRSLAKRLPGKVIVTADHGELLGENDEYGHPPERDDPILRKVPWLEIKCV